MDECDLRFLDTLEDIQEAYTVLDRPLQYVAPPPVLVLWVWLLRVVWRPCMCRLSWGCCR